MSKWTDAEIRKAIIHEKIERSESFEQSLEQYREYIQTIDRVAPGYPYYYFNNKLDEVPFAEIYRVLAEMVS